MEPTNTWTTHKQGNLTMNSIDLNQLSESYKAFEEMASDFTEFRKAWIGADSLGCASAMIYFYLAAAQCQFMLEKSEKFELVETSMAIVSSEVKQLASKINFSNYVN